MAVQYNIDIHQAGSQATACALCGARRHEAAHNPRTAYPAAALQAKFAWPSACLLRRPLDGLKSTHVKEMQFEVARDAFLRKAYGMQSV